MFQQNFAYVLEIMETVIREQIRPTKKMMDQLKEFHTNCKRISNDGVYNYFQSLFLVYIKGSV